MLAPVHEARVQAERDVVEEELLADATDVDALLSAVERVEGGERVVAVEPEIPREVVARPVRDADERELALDRDRGHGRKRAVAAGDSEHLGLVCSSKLDEIVAFTDDVNRDAAPARLGR
jgi:hypothetical protein